MPWAQIMAMLKEELQEPSPFYPHEQWLRLAPYHSGT